MEYIKIVSGLALLGIFSWILLKNMKRSGFIHSLLRIDTVIGIAAGLYLIITSVSSLWG
jgi:hypothetical protein